MLSCVNILVRVREKLSMDDGRWTRAAGQFAWCEEFRCTKRVLLTSIFCPISRPAATGEHRTAADSQDFFDQTIREQCRYHSGHVTGEDCNSWAGGTVTSQKMVGSVVILAFGFRLIAQHWANVTMLRLSLQVQVLSVC